MEYHSATKRNASESVLMRWMKAEPIIQREVSQKEKNKYHIPSHIYGIWKDDTDEPVCTAAVETQIREEMGGHGGGRTGWDGWRERHGNICTTLCKQRASRSLRYDSGNSHWGSVTTCRSGMG